MIQLPSTFGGVDHVGQTCRSSCHLQQLNTHVMSNSKHDTKLL